MLEAFLAHVRSKNGLPYVWGGDNDRGYDCSGLIVEGLKKIGLLDAGADRHSSALIDWAEGDNKLTEDEAFATAGAFLYRPGHIAISLGDGRTFEARSPELGIGYFTDGRSRSWTRFGLLDEFKGVRVATGKMSSPAKGTVSSEYGWRPRLTARIPAMFHAGIDIKNGSGTPIYAAYAGVVEKAGWNGVSGRSGQFVLIRNPDGERQYYGHLSVINVRVGQRVVQGQQIGGMGATGNVTGVHLHFEVWGADGKTRNPRVDFNAHGVTPGSTYGQGPASAPVADGDLNRDGKVSYYEYEIDGRVEKQTVIGLQEFLRDRGYYNRAIDGKLGEHTIRGWQNWLKSRGFYRQWKSDGKAEYWTIYESQRYFQSIGQYTGFMLDGGRHGMTETRKALQRVLATTRKSGR